MNKAALAAFGCWMMSGCGGEDPVDAGLPPGALVYGSRIAVERVLGCATQFRGSVVAERANVIRTELGTCEFVTAEASSVSGLADALTCASVQPALASRLGDASIAFAVPVGDGRRAVGTLRVATDGQVDGEAFVDATERRSAADLLVGGGDPGPAVLNDEEAFFHARMKPAEGIDLSRLTPADSQGSKMFRLRNSLFAGALLDGTWEVALYQSEPDHTVPRLAAAIGIRSKDAARTAMESFVSDVQSQWDVTRSEFAANGSRGACFPDLNLLPRLAPCYVVTDHALVVGWEPGSVVHALADSGAAVHGLTVDARALAGADARIAEAETRRGRPRAEPPLSYPWGRIVANAEAVDDRVRWTVHSDGGCP